MTLTRFTDCPLTLILLETLMLIRKENILSSTDRIITGLTGFLQAT